MLAMCRSCGDALKQIGANTYKCINSDCSHFNIVISLCNRYMACETSIQLVNIDRQEEVKIRCKLHGNHEGTHYGTYGDYTVTWGA